MSFKYKVLLIIAPLIFFLDQVTKNLVRKYISFGDDIPIIKGYVDIIHTTNTGAAFGMFSGAEASFKTPFFYIVAFIALTAIALYLIKLDTKDRLMAIVLSMVVGGIFGNISDRIFIGAVTDFVSLHVRDVVFDKVFFGYGFRFPLEWPAFNVADSAITIAIILMVIDVFRDKEVS